MVFRLTHRLGADVSATVNPVEEQPAPCRLIASHMGSTPPYSTRNHRVLCKGTSASNEVTSFAMVFAVAMSVTVERRGKAKVRFPPVTPWTERK